jgi:hypothetical protein
LLSSIIEHFEHLAKGAIVMAAKLVLMQKEDAELKAANEAATRPKSHKRKRVQAEGNITFEDRARLAALKDFGA